MDTQIKELEKQEFNKRDKELCLIASENYCSEDVLNASGSIFQCKYSEGFPNKRYYQGCEVVDKMESECINACLELFNAKEEYYANVQPNSGASANMIVYNAILKAGDKVLSMDTMAGGHISHGHPKSYLAKYHTVETYGVDDNGLLDYDAIEQQAIKFSPKLIVCGASNYSRIIDFKRFKEIADKVGAYLMCDIAHISALVAHGLHPSPVGIADFITFTTHKMLAGPRGGVIIYKQDYDKEIKLSTIPSLFGGPLEQQIYAKLVCFKEQLNNGKTVAKNIIKNAKVMAETFTKYNVPLVSGGTDNHLMTVDLTDYSVTGKQMAEILEECGIIVNCNTVPNDKRSFLETSGIRIGVPAVTTRGLTQQDVKTLTRYISNLINACKEDYESDFDLLDKFEKAHDNLKWHVFDLIMNYPLKDFYPKMYNELFEAKELSWV